MAVVDKYVASRSQGQNGGGANHNTSADSESNGSLSSKSPGQIQYTDQFLQAKSVHNTYVGQRVKDDIDEIMSELDAMKKKNVNSLFNIGGGVALALNSPGPKNSKPDFDILDGLEIGPQGELILKSTESNNSSPVSAKLDKKPDSNPKTPKSEARAQTLAGKQPEQARGESVRVKVTK